VRLAGGRRRRRAIDDGRSPSAAIQ